MKTKNTIVWAVDAFAEKNLQRKGIHFLSHISKSLGFSVDPVYVLSSGQVQIQNELYPTWSNDYKKASETLLKELTKDLSIENLQDPKTLISPESSLRSATEELINYSKNKNVKFIYVNTHANEGLPRFFLGSFTETLLLQSKTPILSVNPTVETPKEIKNILFPTDFSSDSQKGLEEIIDLSINLKAKLTLYHKTLTPLYLSFPEAPFYSVYLEDIKKHIKEKATKCVESAKEKGANCELVMDNSQETGSLGNSIIQYTEKHPVDMICFMTSSTTISAAILGSTARHLVRHAHCPVWVQHT